MSRVKRGTMHAKRRRNLLKDVKGFGYGRKKLVKVAKQALTKALAHSYVDRRRKKRDFRRLWNIKINAAACEAGTTYANLIHGLKEKNIILNRKILAELGEKHKDVFQQVVAAIK